MGYYIETERSTDKAQQIIDLYGAERVSVSEAAMCMGDPSIAVICVVSNSLFDAAGFAYDIKEFLNFNHVSDPRPKTWLKMDRQKAKELTRYKGE